LKQRISSGGRGVFIAALIGIYAWIMREGEVEGSVTVSLLMAAGVQLAVIAVRRFAPADRLPESMSIVELIADGVTVLLFALGIFGGIARMTAIS
jgi:hypothetical protein